MTKTKLYIPIRTFIGIIIAITGVIVMYHASQIGITKVDIMEDMLHQWYSVFMGGFAVWGIGLFVAFK